MCNLCKKWNYQVSDGALVKRARYQTNHLYALRAWSFDARIIDLHLPQVAVVQVRELDRGRLWTISAQEFEQHMQTREDTVGDLHYYVEDRHWTIFDPNGREIARRTEQQPGPAPDLQLRLM